MIDLTPLLRFQIWPPRVLMRPLDLPRLWVPSCPGSYPCCCRRIWRIPSASEGEDRWEPLRAGLWVIRSQLDALPVGESPDIEKPSPLSWPVGWIPHLTILMIWRTPMLENVYRVFSLSPVRLLHPSLWGFSSFSYPSSSRWSFSSCGSPSSTPRSFVTPRPSSFTSAWA